MKTVLCHGAFDVLHNGHLKHLEAAKRFGDILCVSITSDKYINKGPGRPYFSAEKREEMLKALKIVDRTMIVDDPTAIPAIEYFKPDYYVKGPDYRDFSKDVTGQIIREKEAVEAHGGQLVFTDEEVFSSSTIINRYFQGWTDAQKGAIEKIKSLGGIDAVCSAVEALSKLRVLVIGEPISDIYRFVTPEGLSSKSPTVSCRFQYEEMYKGGASAIYNHLKDFCETFTPDNLPAPQKIRYISTDRSQRVFEVTHIDEKNWPHFELSKLIIDAQRHCDVLILADFGHGLFNSEVLEAMESINGPYIGLNVQTNSSNFGFNVYNKHKRFHYLCLDTREARLAEHDRYSSPITIAHSIQQKTKASIGLTVGSNGAYLLTPDRVINSPAFSDVVVDAMGAGDAYFAITTCLLASECPVDLIPFIGNVFAGLKTRIQGNKGVSKASLLKAVRGVLA